MSLQVRVSNGGEGERWERSIWIGRDTREVRVPFSEFRPTRAGQPAEIPVAGVDTVLVVAEALNTRPGTNGQIWIQQLRAER